MTDFLDLKADFFSFFSAISTGFSSMMVALLVTLLVPAKTEAFLRIDFP
jgi:hypothetical protein